MSGVETKPLPDAWAIDWVDETPALPVVVNAPKLIAARALLVSATALNLPSPCISVCRMSDGTGLCEGCFRTIEEIGAWGKSDDAAKRALWKKIEQRAAASVVA